MNSLTFHTNLNALHEMCGLSIQNTKSLHTQYISDSKEASFPLSEPRQLPKPAGRQCYSFPLPSLSIPVMRLPELCHRKPQIHVE